MVDDWFLFGFSISRNAEKKNYNFGAEEKFYL